MKSLRLKIILITLAIIFLALTVSTLFTVKAFKAYYTDALTAQSEIFGQNIRSIIDSLLQLGLALEQFEGMNDKLAELVGHTAGIAYCRIYDAQGKLLYRAEQARVPELVFTPVSAGTFPPQTPALTTQYTSTTGEVYYDTVSPLYTEAGQYIGTLRVGFPAAVISEKIATLLATAATSLVLSFLVAAGVFLVFCFRSITQPISRLLAATQAIARGDLRRRIRDMSKDELGKLAVGFNDMADNLSALINELEHRNTFASALISIRDLEPLLDTVVKGVAQSGDYDRVRLYLYDEPQHSLICRAAFGMEEEKVRDLHIALGTEGAGVSQWVFVHRTPYIVSDATTDPKCNPELIRMLAVNSYAVVPLLAGEKALGVVAVDNLTTQQPFVPERLNSLVAFANTAALAIDNALLYRNLEERVKERTFQLEVANARLQELDQIKSDFLSTVSHELRTPLTSVLGFSKMIAKRFTTVLQPHLQQADARVQRETTRVQENLEIIIDEGERLTRLVNDVLDLAKIEAGKVEWKMQDVSLFDIVQSAVNATSALARDRGLDIRLVPQGDGFHVYGDHDRLVQVVTNLLSNAIKFTDEGTITCLLAHDTDTVTVKVIDTGIGIAQADLDKVFEKFKQVGDTLTNKPKGTGLGLPICKEIIEHHGGGIWVESELGTGSTFSFTLPALTAPMAQVDVPLLSRLKHRVSEKLLKPLEEHPLILIADDELHIRTLLRQELESAGYTIIEAQDGQEALRLARDKRPDLIILDVMMPGLDGFDVTRILKNDADTAGIPIMILSIIEDKDKGYKLGVDSYLTKPVEAEQLLATVSTLLPGGGYAEQRCPEKFSLSRKTPAWCGRSKLF
jgi:signal transduction histidine kinase/ActR/RegA family two-component response regulator